MHQSQPPHPLADLRGRGGLFAAIDEAQVLELEASGHLRSYWLDPGERLDIVGRDDGELVYLLSGAADLAVDDAAPVTVQARVSPSVLPAGARLGVVATTATLLYRVARRELDFVVGWSSLQHTTDATDDEEGGFQGFLRRLHHPAVFCNLPMHSVETAYRQMRPRDVEAGEQIVTEGEAAGDFYVIESGSAEVWQSGIYDDTQRQVAELGPGDHFGGDALTSGGTRNASVRMSSAGRLRVLAGDQFQSLVRQPLLHVEDASVVRAMIDSGERKVVDVRFEEEWEGEHLADVQLMPLPELRGRLAELDAEQKYITVCHSGNRSGVAAMILMQNGFDAVSLKGGYRDWPYDTVSEL